jgi:ferredoxin--NADP+ reductase
MPYSEQTVTAVRPWSDRTFSLTLTRPADFAFANGEFVTIGLKSDGKLIARAYSIVSTQDDDHLEFLSIHVPEGPLTSRLVKVRPGDSVWVNSKATGSLTLAHVLPGRNLYLLATGTGLAPFMSLIRDPATYRAHEKIILAHTVRTEAELVYREELETRAGDALRYVPTVTREAFVRSGRCSDLFISGALYEELGLPPADPAQDRILICGNPDMNRQMSAYLRESGWTMTSHRGVGNFSVEAAFVIHHA